MFEISKLYLSVKAGSVLVNQEWMMLKVCKIFGINLGMGKMEIVKS